MFYAIIFKPQIDVQKIQRIRGKYDLHFQLIDPHITLVFPFPDQVSEEQLIKHIENILKDFKPFEIHLSGLSKSWDHWLNLDVQEGNEEIIKLHDALYTSLLAPLLRKDIEYVPHIGLGLFVDNSSYKVTDPKLLPLDKVRYEEALQEAQNLNLDFRAVVDELELIKLDDNLTKILKSKVFNLPN